MDLEVESDMAWGVSHLLDQWHDLGSQPTEAHTSLYQGSFGMIKGPTNSASILPPFLFLACKIHFWGPCYPPGTPLDWHISDHTALSSGFWIFGLHMYHSVYLRFCLVYTLSFCIFCSLMPVLLNGTRGKTKCAKLKCTPLTPGMIKPFVNNGFPGQSGKSLKLETLDIW